MIRKLTFAVCVVVFLSLLPADIFCGEKKVLSVSEQDNIDKGLEGSFVYRNGSIKLFVKNLNPNKIKVWHYGQLYLTYKLELTDASGQKIKYDFKNKIDLTKLFESRIHNWSKFIILKQNQKRKVATIMLSDWYGNLPAGQYSLQVCFSVDDGFPKENNITVWHGKLIVRANISVK